MKLITFTVPCYNSAAYMDHCIETLLTAGEDAEIILVDDGSKDDTGKIADAYAEKYPTIVRVIHQENGGTARASTRASAMPPASTSRSSTPTTGSTPMPCSRSWPSCAPTSTTSSRLI